MTSPSAYLYTQARGYNQVHLPFLYFVCVTQVDEPNLVLSEGNGSRQKRRKQSIRVKDRASLYQRQLYSDRFALHFGAAVSTQTDRYPCRQERSICRSVLLLLLFSLSHPQISLTYSVRASVCSRGGTVYVTHCGGARSPGGNQESYTAGE